MGRPKKLNAENSNEEQPSAEEQIESGDQAETTAIKDETLSENTEVKPTIDSSNDSNEDEEEKPVQIASRQFVNKLKEEFKKEKISESVYIAFLASVPKVDWEENYRLIWETTFKRLPAKK